MKKPAILLATMLIVCTIIIGGCGLLPYPAPTSNIQEASGLAEQTANPTSTRSEPAPSPTDDATEQPWQTYTNPVLQVAFSYPSGWQYIEGDLSSENFAGSDGYFITGAMGGGGMRLDEVAQSEAQHVLQPFGTQPTIESFTIQGQPARLILPSDDQAMYNRDMVGDAELLVQYPQPLIINDTQADFFKLHAPGRIIRYLAASLTFVQSDLNMGALWVLYSDPATGIAFEYPSLYDQQTYENCRVIKQVLEEPIVYSLGSVSNLVVSPAAGESLQDYARELESSGQISQVTKTETSMAGQPALKVDYRFGGTNRFGILTVVKQGDKFYAFHAEAGGMACNPPGDETFELKAYQHAIDSLMITP